MRDDSDRLAGTARSAVRQPRLQDVSIIDDIDAIEAHAIVAGISKI
jgi:hypothetical protein